MEGVVRHHTMEANGISMHVAETGPEVDAKGTVLFVHGFPELWYSWRHQMEHLAVRGYRCVAPDLRGYGGTSAPPDVASYTAFHIVGDLVALLDALSLAKVFVVGHDWGALIAWYLCVFRPERVTALVNTSVTFMRSIMIRMGPGFVKPTDYFNSTYGPKFYMCRFQVPGVAEQQFMAANAKHLLKQVLCPCFSHGVACEENMDDDPSSMTLPSWLTEADVDYFGASFEKTGFTGAINYYRNLDRNCELAAPGRTPRWRCQPSSLRGPGTLPTTSQGSRTTCTMGGSRRMCRCWRSWWSSLAPATLCSRRRRRR
ncbi:hypothetical protein BRADI_3g56690v3 [Brachypodium distachyon]|uniref:AB hydrolase-1 domain-containing protein n=1 Tax=Brachypodium distachyon TaxID=15368 RepID=A0A0Q3FQA1_BRADI|nr:hypothetical protein BRADI_3g56690v3 [Brachypodium distachyon]PNT69509.1 hypothetical protein BRADI_3g56690v3 [Brachypodium distachyon]